MQLLQQSSHVTITTFMVLFSTHFTFADMTHPCVRNCSDDRNEPMRCYYQFDVELYYTMSKACYDCPHNITDCYKPDCVTADGVRRPITVVNRRLPGPDIQVCVGDTIVVDVSNYLFQEGTTIHWHGISQRGTQYMDGVPFLTQCPIPPQNTFRYEFVVNSAGTNFWHSHMGVQRTDGVFGALIVRSPASQDIHSELYDYDLHEHVIQIIDWINESTTSRMVSRFHSDGKDIPENLLVNGKAWSRLISSTNGTTLLHTPVSVFTVQKDKRYRFRIINAGFLNCPTEVSFQDHNITVISSDGHDIKPIYADSVVLFAGERWDIILNANNNVSNYWIKFRGLLDCDENFNSVFTAAVLHYEGGDDVIFNYSNLQYTDMYTEGVRVNVPNEENFQPDHVNAAEMSTATRAELEPILKPTADLYLTFEFDFYPVDNPLYHKAGQYGFYSVKHADRIYTPQINHVSLIMPGFPLLTEPEQIEPTTFCNISDLNNCHIKYCACTFTVDIPLDAVVEILLIDTALIYEAKANHPFHLHGGSFRVIALDKLNNYTSLENIRLWDETGRIRRNLENPPEKDTVTVPNGGFTILRYHATNPGYWLFHCHLDLHVEAGMSAILKVGEEKDYPSIPDDFPKCGKYYKYNKPIEDEDEEDVETSSRCHVTKFAIYYLITTITIISFNYYYYYSY